MNEKKKSEIARRLREIAHLYGLKLTTLCEQYSIATSSLYSYSSSDCLPAVLREKFLALCEDLWINPDWLLRGQGMPLQDLPCFFLPLANVVPGDLESLKKYIKKSARGPFWASLEELDAWIFSVLEKIYDKLNAYKSELLTFQDIVKTYFQGGIESLTYEQKRKISYYIPDSRIADLFQLDQRFNFKEFWEKYVLGDIGMALNPDAPFRRAYKELTEVILFDAKVPNCRQLTNRPTLCPQCLKVVCPDELRSESGKCPYCDYQILEFILAFTQ